jgi:hypothetical protein
MDARQHPLSLYWIALGLLLAALGGIPLLSGTAAESNSLTRPIAKLLVGTVIIGYGLWVRRREDRSTQLPPPNEET